MAQTTEEWLSEKLSDYTKNKQECIEDMLITTTEILKQYIGNENSKAANGVLDACLKHNELFLKQALNYEMSR